MLKSIPNFEDADSIDYERQDELVGADQFGTKIQFQFDFFAG